MKVAEKKKGERCEKGKKKGGVDTPYNNEKRKKEGDHCSRTGTSPDIGENKDGNPGGEKWWEIKGQGKGEKQRERKKAQPIAEAKRQCATAKEGGNEEKKGRGKIKKKKFPI